MRGSSRVTVVGEALVDLLWRRGAQQVVPVPGGSPANVAVGLQRLERPVTLVTTWGDDFPGALVRDHLLATGVDVRRAPAESGRTMLALAYLDEDGSATYDFLAAWDPDDLPVPEDTAVLHTGSLAVVVEPGASRVLELCRTRRAASGGRPTAVAADLNVRPAVQRDRERYREAGVRLAAVTDVLKASDEDLAWLYPDLGPAQAARLLLAEGPRAVVVTLGGEGALAVSRDAEVSVPAPAVPVADTVGAGDAFQAALLDAIAEHGVETVPGAGAAAAGDSRAVLPQESGALAAVLRRCVTAAAVNCTRTGANPPTRAELDAELDADPGAAERTVMAAPESAATSGESGTTG